VLAPGPDRIVLDRSIVVTAEGGRPRLRGADGRTPSRLVARRPRAGATTLLVDGRAISLTNLAPRTRRRPVQRARRRASGARQRLPRARGAQWQGPHRRASELDAAHDGGSVLAAFDARPVVSTPVSWDDVTAAVTAADARTLVFETNEVLGRVASIGDLFAPVLAPAQRLDAGRLNETLHETTKAAG
jgi:hypothetical protein